MAWIALLALLVIAMLALEAIGAERNFRRRGAPLPAEAEASQRDWSKHEGVALDRIARFPRTRLPSPPARALSTRHFSSCL